MATKQPKFNYEFATRGSIPDVTPRGTVQKKKSAQKQTNNHKYML